MKLSETGHRELQTTLCPIQSSPVSHSSWKDTLRLPNKTDMKKLAAWPMAMLMPALLSPARAQVANCQDASATSYISIEVDDASAVIPNITAGCSATCMGASIAQLPASLCSTSLCANSTVGYKGDIEAFFTAIGNNLTFMNCMHGVTDASVQPAANASYKSTTLFIIISCSVVGGILATAITGMLIGLLVRRERNTTEAVELPQPLGLQPENV